MRKKSIMLMLIPFFLIISVSLQNSDLLSIQPYIAVDVNNTLTTAAIWSNSTVISDDPTGWNDENSERPSIAVDGSGNLHVVWADNTNGTWGTDYEIMYANYTSAGWSNATVISDDATGWNDGISYDPQIAIDGIGNLHVVWDDETIGEWGTDSEIMYSNNTGAGWSNATVISDDATGWNNQTSEKPSIAIDGIGNIHVVWDDDTDGTWGNDREIMYVTRTGAGWSNATVISDDATGWNDGVSSNPTIAIDAVGNEHVVWEDTTNGEWGTDTEIMYAINIFAGWSNATVISDDATGWNDGTSWHSAITIDYNGNLHVVWEDQTDGEWGSDTEIMYVNYTAAGWSNATVISDDATGWNTGPSYNPSIAVYSYVKVHVVWEDYTDGEWGTDTEIMYVNYTVAGWSNITVISDDPTGWNTGGSLNPCVIVDINGTVHAVWEDYIYLTATESEILYSNTFISQPSDGDEPTNLIIVPLPDSSISLLSPLGLGIIGIAVAATAIITVIITKKIRE